MRKNKCTGLAINATVGGTKLKLSESIGLHWKPMVLSLIFCKTNLAMSRKVDNIVACLPQLYCCGKLVLVHLVELYTNVQGDVLIRCNVQCLIKFKI